MSLETNLIGGAAQKGYELGLKAKEHPKTTAAAVIGTAAAVGSLVYAVKTGHGDTFGAKALSGYKGIGQTLLKHAKQAKDEIGKKFTALKDSKIVKTIAEKCTKAKETVTGLFKKTANEAAQ